MITFNKTRIKYIIKKTPMCDTCICELYPTGIEHLSYPKKIEYQCRKCAKKYSFLESELEDEIVYENVEE